MRRIGGRLLAVGDIHGHLDRLEALMAEVAPAPDDTVVFLGDYIDRGPDSRGVIEYLIGFGERFPGAGAIFLRGNHEQLFLDFLAEHYASAPLCPPHLEGHRRLREISRLALTELGDSDRDNFLLNGGVDTLDSYGALREQAADEGKTVLVAECDRIPPEHIAFLATTRFWHEEAVSWVTGEGTRTGKFLFVHAGILPRIPLEQQDPMTLLWVRNQFLRSNSRFGGRTVVHGHSPSVRVPGGHPRRICVDSGVCRHGRVNRYSTRSWGRLTCCNVLDRRIWQS